MFRHRERGEGMVGILIIAVLVVLVCVVAAQFLGKEIVSLIVGTDEANRMMEGAVDNIEIGDGEFEEPRDPPPDPDETEP